MPGTAEWNEADLNNQRCSTEKQRILLENPALEAATAANEAAGAPFPADPFRALNRWAGKRGNYELTTFTDRSGTERSAALFGPLDAGGGPRPGVLLLCHACGGFPIPGVPRYESVEDLPAWYWAAEALAEAGYIAMVAELFGNESERAVDATDFFLASPEVPTARGEFNPWHAQVDTERLGIAGHSGAALVAIGVGNGDPRFDAVVGWDPAPVGDLMQTVDPRAPTMVHTGDYLFGAEARPQKPVPEPGSRYTFFDSIRAAGVDTMQVAPRASTHMDWVEIAGSIYGTQVATYYTLAWFDRYLSPSRGERSSAAVAEDALRRLTVSGAEPFDGSSDAYSISAGFFDAGKAESAGNVEAGNVPITIEGIPVRNLLSFHYDTRYFLENGTISCENVRSGCD